VFAKFTQGLSLPPASRAGGLARMLAGRQDELAAEIMEALAAPGSKARAAWRTRQPRATNGPPGATGGRLAGRLCVWLRCTVRAADHQP